EYTFSCDFSCSGVSAIDPAISNPSTFFIVLLPVTNIITIYKKYSQQLFKNIRIRIKIIITIK
ncbi:hypothetical protein, partial [Enterococcus faecalis]|uniref:hypothetical protein n=1 Tax=Enterococcus faecalis TaxID=1351 RepID=UPI003CC593CB